MGRLEADTAPPVVWWVTCGGCGRLFPGAPEEMYCAGCLAGWRVRNGRRQCQAAHPDDASLCEGPRYAVRVVDGVGAVASGCVAHGAVLLASLVDGRVYPGSVDGAAIAVFRRARALRPFAFGAGRWSR